MAPTDETSAPSPPPPRSVAALLIGSGCVAMFVAAFLLDIGASGRTVSLFGWTLPEICFWRRTLGTDCPGCGLTRSVVALCRLDGLASLRFHPAGVAVAFAAALQIWKLFWGSSRLARSHAWQQLERVAFWALIVGFAIGIVRWAHRLVESGAVGLG